MSESAVVLECLRLADTDLNGWLSGGDETGKMLGLDLPDE